MEWVLEAMGKASSEEVYALMREHRLIAESPYMAADACTALQNADHYEVRAESGQKVADIFVSAVYPGESAVLDIVPVSRFFRGGFDEPLASAVSPLLASLFDGEGVRRITSTFPASRPRTKRALDALGFEPEGRMESAVRLYGEEPTALRIFGLLASKWRKGGS